MGSRLAFWRDLRDETKWRAAARQMVRLHLLEGYTPYEAIVLALRISRARGVVLDELRDLATEA